MRRILIFGNSGAGKTTLAQQLVEAHGLAHLDLDGLAWLPTTPPQRAGLNDAREQMEAFIHANPGWVIEGCYTDLLDIAAPFANEALFLNPGVARCIENARARPWEPHKYASQAAQDANLEMLIGWIRQYDERDDVLSFQAHAGLYERFKGTKSMFR